MLAFACLLIHGGTAGAQAPPEKTATEAEPETIDAIVVTARRRAENLQDTPVAITALSADALERQQIVSTTDLDKVAPNLQFHSYGTLTGNNSAAQVFIRGIGQTDATPAVDPASACTSTMSTWAARSVQPWNSGTSPTCRSCAARREPCLAATRLAAPCC